MAVFFFDVHTDAVDVRDYEGVELPDLGAAVDYCGSSLVEIAKGCLTHETTQCITIRVRNRCGSEIAAKTMMLTSHTSDDPPRRVRDVVGQWV